MPTLGELFGEDGQEAIRKAAKKIGKKEAKRPKITRSATLRKHQEGR